MRIEFHPEADAEFSTAIDFYNACVHALGNRFYEAVMARLDWIAANSEIYRDQGGYRRINLRVFPYYIAYQIDPDRIWVVAIAHGHRRPGYWLGRLKSD